MSADLTIILPTYNRRHVLKHSIGCYRELAKRWPLLVVDDGSHDGTAGWVEQLGIRVLRLAHRGLPAARNAGLHAVNTTWVLFGEDDVIMPADTPDILLGWSQRLPRCGALCGRSFVGNTWTLTPTYSDLEPLDGQRMLADHAGTLVAPRLLPTLHARSLIRRSAALDIGGFDTSLLGSAFREDSDFFARLWCSRWACWQVPNAWEVHVRHRLGGGCRGGTGLIAKVYNRSSYWHNNARFLDRHHRMWSRWIPVPPPGRMKARYAYELITTSLKALRG